MQYTVAIDWDNDGSFATSGDDISAYVKSASLRLGISDAQAHMAEIGQCTLTLDNADRRFSPANGASPYAGKFRPNLPVLVQVTDGATYTIFRGVTRQFSATPGTSGPREATIVCEDLLSVLQAFRLSLPLQTDRKASALIGLILAQVFEGGLASGEVRFSGQPSAGESVTINEIAYQFATTPTSNYQVQIGATLNDTARNLADAINNGDGAGTRYYVSNTRPSGVTAALIPSYWRTVQEDRPVRCYRLGEAVGPTAVDTGLNGRNGTMGAGVVPGYAGALANDPDYALHFGGASPQRVDLPTLDMSNRSFTVEAWVKPSSSSPPAQQTWFGMYQSPGTPGYVFVCRTASNGQITIGWGANDLTSGLSALTFGAWTHVVVTYDVLSDVTTLYLNGTYHAEKTGSGGPFLGGAPTISIGATGSLSEWWKGEIDEVAVYWGVLPAARIAAHYAARNEYNGVRIAANCRGAWANTLPLAESASNVTVSGATLAGGSDEPAGLVDLEAGVLTFDTAGDTWTADRTNALAAIAEAVESEQGYFWAARNGVLTFRNQTYLLRPGPPALLLNSEPNALESAVIASEIYNQVVVSFSPRRALANGVIARANGTITVPGQSGMERWNGTVKLPGGGSTTVKLPFVDPSTGRLIGARSLKTPLTPGTHYTVNDRADGTGADYTTYASITFSAVINGADVEVTIRNAALGPLYVTKLEIEGVGIVGYEDQQVVREDAASIADFGTRALTVGLPLGNAQIFAEALADSLLERYREPAYRVGSLTFRQQTAIGAVKLYALEIGDVITLTDAQLGISGQRSMILGVQYQLGAGGASQITFSVRALDDKLYWILDDAVYGQLGITTRLGV